MSTSKVSEITDETLLKCMRDFLENPVRYHPEYLDILLKDYVRRVVDKGVNIAAPREFPDVNTSKNATIPYA